MRALLLVSLLGLVICSKAETVVIEEKEAREVYQFRQDVFNYLKFWKSKDPYSQFVYQGQGKIPEIHILAEQFSDMSTIHTLALLRQDKDYNYNPKNLKSFCFFENDHNLLGANCFKDTFNLNDLFNTFSESLNVSSADVAYEDSRHAPSLLVKNLWEQKRRLSEIQIEHAINSLSLWLGGPNPDENFFLKELRDFDPIGNANIGDLELCSDNSSISSRCELSPNVLKKQIERICEDDLDNEFEKELTKACLVQLISINDQLSEHLLNEYTNFYYDLFESAYLESRFSYNNDHTKVIQLAEIVSELPYFARKWLGLDIKSYRKITDELNTLIFEVGTFLKEEEKSLKGTLVSDPEDKNTRRSACKNLKLPVPDDSELTFIGFKPDQELADCPVLLKEDIALATKKLELSKRTSKLVWERYQAAKELLASSAKYLEQRFSGITDDWDSDGTFPSEVESFISAVTRVSYGAESAMNLYSVTENSVLCSNQTLDLDINDTESTLCDFTYNNPSQILDLDISTFPIDQIRSESANYSIEDASALIEYNALNKTFTVSKSTGLKLAFKLPTINNYQSKIRTSSVFDFGPRAILNASSIASVKCTEGFAHQQSMLNLVERFKQSGDCASQATVKIDWPKAPLIPMWHGRVDKKVVEQFLQQLNLPPGIEVSMSAMEFTPQRGSEYSFILELAIKPIGLEVSSAVSTQLNLSNGSLDEWSKRITTAAKQAVLSSINDVNALIAQKRTLPWLNIPDDLEIRAISLQSIEPLIFVAIAHPKKEPALLSSYDLYGTRSSKSGSPSLVWGKGKLLIPPQLAVLLSGQNYSNLKSQLPEPLKLLDALLLSDNVKSQPDALVIYLNKLQPIYATLLDTQISLEEKTRKMEQLLIDARVLIQSEAELYVRLENILKDVLQGLTEEGIAPSFPRDINEKLNAALINSAPQYLLNANIKEPLESVLGQSLLDKQALATSIILQEFKLALASEAQRGGLTPCVVEKEALSKCPLPASVLTQVNANINKSLFVIHEDNEHIYENPGFGLVREDIDKALNSLRNQTANFVKDNLEELWKKSVKTVVANSTLVLNDKIKTALAEGFENLSCDISAQRTSCEFVLRDLSLRLWGLAYSSLENIRNDTVKSEPLLRELFFEFRKNPRLKEVIARLIQRQLNLCVIDTTREDCSAWSRQSDSLEKKWVKELLNSSNRLLTAVAQPMEQFRQSVEVTAVELETRVRAKLPLSVVEGALYFSRDIDSLGIIAGDQLTGTSCDYEEKLWHCKFEPKTVSEIANNLDSIKNDRIEISRGDKKHLLSLGYEMVYLAQLAPVVEGINRFPEQYVEEVELFSDQAASQLKNVRYTTARLADIQTQITNIAKEKGGDVLDSVLAPFTEECSKYFATISNSCDSPSGFLEDISRTDVAGYARQHIQRILVQSRIVSIASIRNVDYRENCINQTGTLSNVILNEARDAMCTKFQSETLGVIDLIPVNRTSAENKARLLPQKVLQAFGASLATKLNNKAFQLAYELAYGEGLNHLHALKTSFEIRQFGLCLTMSPLQKLVPVEKPEQCASPGKYFQDISKFEAHVREQVNNEVASSLESLYETSKKDLRRICVRTGNSLVTIDSVSEEYCGNLEEMIQNPQQVVDSLKDTAEKIAKNQLHNIALSYLEAMGVFKEDTSYCVDFTAYGLSKICNKNPHDLFQSIEKLGKDKLEEIAVNHEQRVIDEMVQPATAKMEQVASELCRKVNELFSNEFYLFGGKAQFARNAKCPSNNLDLTLDLVIDSFSPKNRRVKITGGVKLDEKQFQKALDEGKPAKALSFNWQQIAFSPSLDTIINDELTYDNSFITLDRITPTQNGINVAATMKPSKYSFIVPLNLIVDETGFQLKVDDFSDALVNNLCLEAKKYFMRERPKIFDGAVIVDSPTSYCKERKFKGLELSVRVDFASPLNQQQLQVFVDVERGLIIEMPDSKSLVASAALKALGVSFLTPVPPFYNYDDGLSLFFDGTIATPLDLNLEFGFLVSPRKMAYRGPIGLKIPGWYDTSAVSLGNLGLQFQPEQKLITFRGSVTTTPGEVTHKLIRIDGSASLGLKDFVLVLRGSVKVLSALDLMTSTTTIAFNERLFETKVNSGPLLTDLLAVNGLLRVQDKKPYPYFKVEGEGELFGAEIAKADVLLKRDFSGHFAAKLEVPVTKQGGQFTVRSEAKLSNLSAKGDFKVAHLSPFNFDLSIEANNDFVETGIILKPPEMELSVKLPSLKSLTAEYLLSLILDLKLKFELTNKLDFTSVPENKGGGVKDSSFKNPPTGEKTEKKKAEQTILTSTNPKALSLSGTWYNRAVTHSKNVWFGIKIGTKYWTEWVPTFNNARISRMASEVGLNAGDMKAGNFYYAERDAYEFLIGTNGVASNQIFVFLKDQSLIWKGRYESPATEITRRIITHKLKADKNILVTRDSNGTVYVSVQKGLIDTTSAEHKIKGSSFLGEDKFAIRLLGDLGAELAWNKRVHELIEVGDKNKWALLSSKNADGSRSYSLVHFDENRTPMLITYQVKTAGDSANHVESIKGAIQSNHLDLGIKFRDACKGKNTDLINPCGYMVTGVDWLFAIEAPADLNLKYEHAYWASAGKTYESNLYVLQESEPNILLDLTGKPLEDLLGNLFSEFNSISDVDIAYVKFDSPMRMALSVKNSEVDNVIFIAEDTLKRGDTNPHQADINTFRCMEQYLSKSANGRALSPSSEQLNKLNIDKKGAWLQGLAWPGKFIELGFKSDPINSIFADCGG